MSEDDDLLQAGRHFLLNNGIPLDQVTRMCVTALGNGIILVDADLKAKIETQHQFLVFKCEPEKDK